MSQINYYTAEGLKKLKDELNDLKTVQRPSISEQIGEARDKGDLSENETPGGLLKFEIINISR